MSTCPHLPPAYHHTTVMGGLGYCRPLSPLPLHSSKKKHSIGLLGFKPAEPLFLPQNTSWHLLCLTPALTLSRLMPLFCLPHRLSRTISSTVCYLVSLHSVVLHPLHAHFTALPGFPIPSPYYCTLTHYCHLSPTSSHTPAPYSHTLHSLNTTSRATQHLPATTPTPPLPPHTQPTGTVDSTLAAPAKSWARAAGGRQHTARLRAAHLRVSTPLTSRSRMHAFLFCHISSSRAYRRAGARYVSRRRTWRKVSNGYNYPRRASAPRT